MFEGHRLALALAAIVGCGGSPGMAGADARSSGMDGGAADDARTVDTGAPADAGAVETGGADADGGYPWPGDPTLCKEPVIVSVDEFCAREAVACGFPGNDGRYTSMEDCRTRYSSFRIDQQQCVALHLCIAGTPGNDAQHCAHTGGASADTTENVCSLPLQ